MTVKELIDVLKDRDPDAVVYIQHMDDGGYYNGNSEVTEVDWRVSKKVVLF